MDALLTDEQQEVLNLFVEYEGDGTPVLVPGLSAADVAVYLGHTRGLSDDGYPIPDTPRIEATLTALTNAGYLTSLGKHKPSGTDVLVERWASPAHAARLAHTLT